jgi:CubicO group peptidase (beta-lactamase class C family)
VAPASTVFDVASLTKVVATTAALIALVDDGLVELDAPVRQYLPEFRGERRDAVTVRHLLAHNAGLPPGEWLFGRTASPEAAMAVVYEAPILKEPGAEARYSDFGMMLLAEVVRRRTEEPLDEFLARRVYGPLGMESTFFLPPAVLRDRIVPTVETNERPYPLQGVVHDANAFRLGGVTGHAGLFSTAADVAVFAQAMLNGGAYGSERILPEGLVRGFARRQPRADNRALGWETPRDLSSAGLFFSARSFGHTGFTGTSLWIDPEHEFFVVILTNRTHGRGTTDDMLRIRRQVHDAAARAVADRPIPRRPGSR